MRRYETLIVLHPELPEAQIRETIDRAKRLIEEGGGSVSAMQEWGMRELAYPIRKLHRGYYVLAEYSSSADVVRELERTLKIADEILRFVSVVAVEAKAKEASAPKRRKSDAPETEAAPVE
ncbi:MAG: 30S ribosomal protein S6 [Deltaproteobacteria bacterium]|nr:30S ribosomal protein S6 [Deltaproteobacteria bacterium]